MDLPETGLENWKNRLLDPRLEKVLPQMLRDGWAVPLHRNFRDRVGKSRICLERGTNGDLNLEMREWSEGVCRTGVAGSENLTSLAMTEYIIEGYVYMARIAVRPS